jgi:hypothetical protein
MSALFVLADFKFWHLSVWHPKIFRAFASHTLRISSPSPFDHFHRLPAIHFPPNCPTHITLFSFSRLISRNCSLTPTCHSCLNHVAYTMAAALTEFNHEGIRRSKNPLDVTDSELRTLFFSPPNLCHHQAPSDTTLHAAIGVAAALI